MTSKNTPNIDFPHSFPESRVDRVRSLPGVLRADNLILSYMNMRLPSGAEESVIAYAMRDFKRWGLPWKVSEGDLDDLKRGPYMFLDGSAEKRFGQFSVGDYREVLGTRLRIIGRSIDALSFTTTPIAFIDFDQAQRMQPSLLARQHHVHAGQARARRRSRRGARADRRAPAAQRRVHVGASGPSARATTGSSTPASA